MKINKPFLLLLAMLLVVLAACSPTAPAAVAPADSQPEAMPTEPPKSEPEIVATEPVAAHPMQLPTEAELSNPIDAEIKPAASNFPIGKYVSVNEKSIGYKFNGDGTFAYYYASVNPVVEGMYTVDGDLLTVDNPTETEANCKGPVTYQWFFNGEQLTFAATGEDTCVARRESFGDVYLVDDSSRPEISIDAADYSYTALDTVQSGWVRVNLTNSGAEPHHVQFLRLNDGITLEQFQEALKQGEGPAMALVQQVGGVGAIAPTGSAQAILNLTAGEYVILCLIPSPADGIPHFAKGMIKSMTVLPASDLTASEPAYNMVVNLKDYSFNLPESLTAGLTTIKVTNEGPEPHEFNILRLAEGKTSEDVFNFLTAPDGPPPFIPVGGMNGLDLGLSGYLEYNFEPGSYVAICNIPSPKAEGHPHFTLGMIKQFEVQAPTTANIQP